MASRQSRVTVHYIGRTGDSARVFARVELSETAGGGTVEHEQVGATLRLRVSGFTIEPHRRLASSTGQILDGLANVTNPAKGWTRADVESLLSIWRRWHLNDMRAGCAHMPADARQRFGRRETVECEAGSGYKYGHAWLIEPLPADVVREVERLQSLPTGSVPATY